MGSIFETISIKFSPKNWPLNISFFMEGEVRAKWEKIASVFHQVLIETVGFVARTCLSLSPLASNPLFSIFVALYFLILLYFPHLFLGLVFSPVLISTGFLLAILLRFGTAQKDKSEIFRPRVQEIGSKCETEMITEADMKWDFPDTFVEWNRRAPLEVIYEEYEGEEEDGDSREYAPEWEKRRVGIALSYPDSDSGSSWDGEFPSDFPVIESWDSPENLCFVWEEEKEGLIEIPLEGKGSVGFQVEEENLIEIDLFAVGK